MRAAAQGALVAVETPENIKDDCLGDAFELAIQQQVGDSTTTIVNNGNSNTATIVNNSNTNTWTIVSNDNSNTTSIITNSNANTATLNTAIEYARTTIIASDNANRDFLRDLMLRTRIEADNATPVALYVTPTANGGYLDRVQAIVTETLENVVAAGGSIGPARTFLAQANNQKAAGQFKSAHATFRRAYKAAIN